MTDNINWQQDLSLQIPDNETIETDNFNCVVVDGKGMDTIFQFFGVRTPEFSDVIAEVIEDHFGNTAGFAIEYVPELKMYGLLAKDHRENPLYNKDHQVYNFLDLLDSTITELKG